MVDTSFVRVAYGRIIRNRIVFVNTKSYPSCYNGAAAMGGVYLWRIEDGIKAESARERLESRGVYD